MATNINDKINDESGENSPDQLSKIQKEEILRRERDFKAGKIKTEPWTEVRKHFLRA